MSEIKRLQAELLALRSNAELKAALFTVEFGIPRFEEGQRAQSFDTRSHDYNGLSLSKAFLYQTGTGLAARVTPGDNAELKRQGYAEAHLIPQIWRDLVAYRRLYGNTAEPVPALTETGLPETPKLPGRPKKVGLPTE